MSLRRRLRVLVGTTASAFLLLIGLNAWIGEREARELTTLETKLVPKLELAPKLRNSYYDLRRGLEDAVSAEDGDALEATRSKQHELLAQLEQARGVLSPREIGALQAAAVAYYTAALAVSGRLIAGETGEAVVGAVGEMQKRQLALATLLEKTTRLDSGQLASAFAAADGARKTRERLALVISFGCLVIMVGLSVRMASELLRSLTQITEGFARFAQGKFDQPIPNTGEGDLGKLAREANRMAESLRRLAEQRDRVDWLRSGIAGLSQELRGELGLDQVASRALAHLVRYTRAAGGALYLRGDGELRLIGAYARAPESEVGARRGFRVGEGLVGQAALETELRVIDDLPPDYARVVSGLGETGPRALVLLPLVYHGEVLSVLELVLLEPCSPALRELFETVRETLAIALVVARSRAALARALEESQVLTQRLRGREDELFENNRELAAQQEELRLANEELSAQRSELGQRNAELEEAHRRLQQKAEELSTMSSYKSQFLANMSHELRTPLNSMLLLSQLLSENSARNLTDKQVEFCKTIHGAGSDLLKLINQVLDLAKIEAGRRDLEFERVPIADFVESARRVFEPLANEKGLRFEVEIQRGAPETLVTDRRSVEQILVNLLGNAVKFTERGSVRLTVSAANAGRSLIFAVSDTGVGIAPEHRERVFAPFEQVGTYRDKRYTGTGLGLAIAKEIAVLLGGQLTLSSTVGEGSTFTLTLPESGRSESRRSESGKSGSAFVLKEGGAWITDDRASLTPNEPHLLAIEDDKSFAEMLVELAHAQELKILVAPTGEEGLRLARYYHPRGILLDVRLPDRDGWSVMAELRRAPETRAIPVHILSALDKPERALALGAVGYLTKPVPRADLLQAIRILSSSEDRRVVRVLIVEDDAVGGESLIHLLAEEGLDALHVSSARAALDSIAAERFDCMILDLGLPDMDGLGLLEELERSNLQHTPAVVVYTGRALTRAETGRLEAYTRAVVFKDGKSTERLLEEIRLFVRHVREGAPTAKKRSWTLPPLSGGAKLEGKRVLLADDDMRTVYALSALLRTKGADVLIADTGKNALDVLEQNPDVDAVLMDVMMPEMDGYEAMRQIRRNARFRALPIIALTAKAMKGERDRCLAEGASDYLTKPVDAERLLSMLTNWLRLDHAGSGS